jgi:hypothetical protein
MSLQTDAAWSDKSTARKQLTSAKERFGGSEETVAIAMGVRSLETAYSKPMVDVQQGGKRG